MKRSPEVDIPASPTCLSTTRKLMSAIIAASIKRCVAQHPTGVSKVTKFAKYQLLVDKKSLNAARLYTT